MTIEWGLGFQLGLLFSFIWAFLIVIYYRLRERVYALEQRLVKPKKDKKAKEKVEDV